MHLEKLITTLKTFNEEELNRLSDYIHSPYFKVPELARHLFSHLQKLHPHFYEKKIQPAVIKKKIPQLINAKKQSNYATELLKSIEGFLALENTNAHPLNQQLHLLQEYKKRHLFKQFTDNYKLVTEKLHNTTPQNIDTLYYRHILTEIAFNGFDTRQQRNQHNNIAPVIETLDAWYALKKMRYVCEAINRQEWFGTPHAVNTSSFFTEALATYNTPQYPYVYLFIRVYHILTTPTFTESEQHHTEIKKHFEQHAHRPLTHDEKEIIPYCINFCLRWHNAGYNQAGNDYLWWIQQLIHHNLLIEKGKLQPATFRNTISTAVKEKHPATWVKNFIETYQHNLPDSERESNTAFALGLYYYTIKDYNNAVLQLNTAEAKNEPILNCTLRRWHFMCLFESGEKSNQLESFLTAYEKYIERNTETIHRFAPVFKNFINHAHKLLHTKNKTHARQLSAELNNLNYFVGKHWLLEQLKSH